MNNAALKSELLSFDPALLAMVLEPYKPNCRYVKSASVDLGRVRSSERSTRFVGLLAECSVPESCYIADTGHFNAVEFNICYNQLAYCAIAACVQHKLLDVFAGWDLADFKRRQLPDVLIVKFSSAFHRPIKSASSFDGRFDITGISINRKGTIFLSTDCSFQDDHGGHAEGNVQLAIVDRSGSAQNR